ncbi:MAG TPA: SCO family protein [Gammaproteobacteria bacterium]|nr:SCO family protein [Chromatiaceae bacterium]MCW5586481.1 SCO family protein [Chromatiales bacterium]HOP16376.1 SCO family protein [Gammaproteobacteria bacterium]
MRSTAQVTRLAARHIPIMLCVLMLSGAVCASEIPRVVVSIKPLHSLLAGLMRGIADPVLLIDGSTVPWEFHPDSAQAEAIEKADILIWSGPELEPGLAAALAQARPHGREFEVLASELLKVLPARQDETKRDPFFWLDSRNMLILLDGFAELMIDIDPDRASAYERNWQRMAEALSVIDRVMEFGYRDVSGAPVFFYHDTHQYFEQAYAMHVAGSVVDVNGAESTDTARLLATHGRVLAVGASCVFTEKGLQEPYLDLLIDGTGAEVVELDSLGAGLPAGADLYVDLMRNNFSAISDCVRKLKPPTASSDTFEAPDVSRSPDRLRPRYAMMDQYGRSVTQADFQGKLQLIYFGYTSCPDICPTSLAVMARALKMLGAEADEIQPIFITVDPQRDTPQLLGEYVTYFHPRMLGLSANPEITRRTAELFRARYELVPAESGDAARYTMDHTASLYLLGRNAEFITKFAHGLPAAEVVDRLRAYLRD